MKFPGLLALKLDYNKNSLFDIGLYKVISLAGLLFYVFLSSAHYFQFGTSFIFYFYFSLSIVFALQILILPEINQRKPWLSKLFYFLVFLGINISFLFDGGFLNPGIFTVFPFILLVIYLTDRKNTTIILSILILNMLVLFLFNYLYPEISFTDTFLSKKVRIISHLICLIYTIITINFIFIKYDNDKRKAQESEKAKEEFLANMSHLIRTPINGINGYSELLLEDEISPMEKKMFRRQILSNAKELHHIIHNLIDLSIIQEKTMVLKPYFFTIEELVQNLQNKAEEEMMHQQKNLRVKTEIQTEIHEYRFNLDGDRLARICWIFIENSIFYSHDSDVLFKIKMDLSEEILLFIIEDSGDGIDENLLNQIQQQSFLERNQSNIANPKPGMGILISRGIIQYFGGDLEITSLKDQGTHVSIKIPIKNSYEKHQ